MMGSSLRKLMWSAYKYTDHSCYIILATMQWSFGVTMWEIFSGGKTPYPGVDPFTLIRFLDNGGRLDKPNTAACSQEM